MRSTEPRRLGLPVGMHLFFPSFQRIHSVLVVAADGLSKRDVFRLPDPFAVITVDAEQTHTTSVIKKTLNPYWNENFDMFVLCNLALRAVFDFAAALLRTPL